MEPLGPCQVREAKDESNADIQRESALKIEETRSRETAAKVMDEETKPSAEQQCRKSQQEALVDTQLGQDHSSSSAQQAQTDNLKVQHQCAVCKKTFTTSSSLRRHQRGTHNGERPYKCDAAECEKAFSQKGTLKRHELTHTGERPYKCATCGKAFSRNAHLSTHQVIHTGEKPHSCSVCGKKFNRSSSCTRHERHHTEGRRFTCFECGGKFSNPEDRKKHQQTHTGEEPR